MALFNLFLIALLIALTAFFVASEFAIVKVRSTKIEEMAADGNKTAQAAKKVIGNLDGYLSACQLGITITSLGLGWLGEPTVEKLLHPVFESFELNPSVVSVLSFAIAFFVITFLHVVVGELAPKTIAIQQAEKLTLLIAKPMIFFHKVMYPFIWLLNGSARVITSMLGFKTASEHEVAHSEEELRIILSESYKSGEINQAEYKFVDKIFEFDNRIAKEIMVPRTEIIAVDEEDSLQANVNLMLQEKYTRFPVMNGDKDHITGVVNLKEILSDLVSEDGIEQKKITQYTRPVIQVIESIPIHDLLVKMQKERTHMAILIDEYGGTAGLVTVEDILEEIVGEIRDEFDIDEKPYIERIDEQTIIVDGKTLIDDVNKVCQLNLDSENVDTIGGWLHSEKIDLQEQEEIHKDDVTFKVLKMDGRHIDSVKISKAKTVQKSESGYSG
ncbi:hemolysin family protein [Bacillus tianshenii]|nr:hemolysin family protein [Bacillus tianshenii]